MTNIIIILVVTVILWIFFKVAKNSKATKTTDGGYVLRYSETIKWSCMGLVIFGTVGLTYLIFKHPIKDEGDLIAIISMYSALALFGAYFYIEFFTVKILISENGIKGASGWRGAREYSWGEINKITYSPTSMWFKISSEEIPPLRIHALITGVEIFQKYYIENLPEEKWIKAHEKFGQNKRVNRDREPL